MIKMLSDRRIDAFLEDQSVIKYNAKTLIQDKKINEAEFPQESTCIKPDALYIAFSPHQKKSKALAEIFDSEFIKIKKTKKWKELLKKYGI